MNWQKFGGGALIFIVAAGLGFGFKFISRANAAKDVKAQLMNACEQDQACVTSVNTHFDVCFNEHYNSGGRRRSGSLDGDKFTACLNQKAGKDYFSYEK